MSNQKPPLLSRYDEIALSFSVFDNTRGTQLCWLPGLLRPGYERESSSGKTGKLPGTAGGGMMEEARRIVTKEGRKVTNGSMK